jgi:LPXTG-motif cell wall-anchored protein
MLRKLAALLLVALSMAIAPLTGAHAGTYSPKLPTTTTIKVIKAVNGKPLVVQFSVKASDGTSPNGSLTYSISRAGAAGGQLVVARAASGSVTMSGSPQTVTGQVAHVGTYVVNASFAPSNSAKYLPSSNVNRATVGSSNGGGGNPGGGSSGGLPNTGGPDFAWVLAGFALLIAGAGAVAYAGRRQPQAA